MKYNCLNLNLKSPCKHCIAYQYQCFIEGYAEWIHTDGIIISLNHINDYPDNKQYFIEAVRLYHPNHMNRIEKLLLLI